MGYFSNVKQVKFKEIEENPNYRKFLEELNVSLDDILEILKSTHYKEITNIISEEYRRDLNVMEPLLYAVKNEHKTFAIYEYYGDNLKDNIDLAKDIVKEEPELIKDTPVSRNKQFILEAVEINPQVISHISQSLKEDTDFVEKLCELNNKEVTKYVARECKMPDVILENPNLAENKGFMLEAIKENVNVLEYVNDNLKNDYTFMREASKNEETINYIVEHTDNFGEIGLTGAKDALIEMSSDEAISGFEEEQKKIIEQIEEHKTESKEESDELEELIKRNKQLERHADFLRRIKNGEVDAVRVAKLMDKLCVNLDEKYREEIKKVLKLDEAILEKQKEEKANEQSNGTIKPENIEKAADEVARFKGIESETGAIRENMNTKENVNKIGEKDVNESNDERA